MVGSGDEAQEKSKQSRRMRLGLSAAISFTALLWVIKLFEHFFYFDLSVYGVYPQSLAGLAGILFAPLIHGSFHHLAANTAPCLVLITLLLYGYPRAAKWVIPIVYFGTGFCVWLFARQYFHIGASGLTFGFMFFVFAAGVFRRDKQSIALSVLVFFLYGSMLGGFVPNGENVSYETHIAAALIGLLLAIVLRKLDPPPAVKQYSWEIEGEDDDLYGEWEDISDKTDEDWRS